MAGRRSDGRMGKSGDGGSKSGGRGEAGTAKLGRTGQDRGGETQLCLQEGMRALPSSHPKFLV